MSTETKAKHTAAHPLSGAERAAWAIAAHVAQNDGNIDAADMVRIIEKETAHEDLVTACKALIELYECRHAEANNEGTMYCECANCKRYREARAALRKAGVE